jgi:hypothetical protein
MKARETAAAPSPSPPTRLASLAVQAEAAYVPALKTTVELLKGALATEKDRNAELRAERDRLSARRSWWPWRRAG